MINTPKLGLVTVLYNAPDVLPDFFASLACQAYKDFHLYVVDNSNKPEPLAVAKALAAQYDIATTFIDNEGNNVGVAAGNNQGIKAALIDSCEFVGLINNDLIFRNREVIAALMQHSLNGETIVSPLILSYPENKIWYAGGYFNDWKAIAPHVNFGKKYEKNSPIDSHFSYAPTCFLIINKSVFTDVGIMDERYFAYYDDTDFMCRANKKNHYVFLDSNSIISHKVSSSTGGDLSYFGIYHLTRNRIYFAKKNLSLPYRPISIMYTVLTRLIRAFTSDESIRDGYLRGIISGIKMKVE
jgi:GT2 family glycosyltransferase